MGDLIERARAAAQHSREFGPGTNAPLLDALAAALKTAQMGLRYAVRVWVLADEIEWSEAEIDEAVERIIGYAKKEARNG